MTIGGTRWPGPTFRDQYTLAEEAVMEAGQAESERYGTALLEVARLRAALTKIDQETRHISGNAGRLGQIARAALSEEEK